MFGTCHHIFFLWLIYNQTFTILKQAFRGFKQAKPPFPSSPSVLVASHVQTSVCGAGHTKSNHLSVRHISYHPCRHLLFGVDGPSVQCGVLVSVGGLCCCSHVQDPIGCESACNRSLISTFLWWKTNESASLWSQHCCRHFLSRYTARLLWFRKHTPPLTPEP